MKSFSRLSENEVREIRANAADPRYRAMNAREQEYFIRYSGQTPAERFDDLLHWLRVMGRMRRFEANREVLVNTICLL